MKNGLMRVISVLLLGLLVGGIGCSDEVVGEANNGKDPDRFDVGSDASKSDADDVKGEGDVKDGSDASGPGADVDDVPPGKSCLNQYSRVCDDACVNVKVDADNCGACGVKCGAGEACAGGVCATGCGAGEQICGRECVDVKSNSDHCGACGTKCGAGKGCNAGRCVPSLDYSDAKSCEGGGPVIDIDWGGGQDRCSGAVAEAAFRWAACSCSSVQTTGAVTTDAFDSTIGPYVPGVLGGGVGVNGKLSSTRGVNIGGSLWVSDKGKNALQAKGKAAIELQVAGTTMLGSGFQVGGDAAVGGYTLNGTFAVGGTLTVPDGGTMTGNATYQSLVRAPVTVADPCSCDAEQLVPIAAIVEARRTKNDNSLIGLDSKALGKNGTVNRLDLPCGNYFLEGIDSVNGTTIVAHGRTALYIKGNVGGTSRVTIKAMPDAEIDVFIDGNLQVTSGLSFGSKHYPAATRLYLGGSGGLNVTSGMDIGGFLYVYPGVVSSTGLVEIFGGVFANGIDITAGINVHYDRQIQRVGDSCPGNPGTDPTPGNQCVSMDGACGASGDCCAPLLCNEGKCGLNRCLVTGDTCVYDSDCCGQICAKDSGKNSGLCVAN